MPSISRFAIKGLYGERDIDIPFDDHIKILVAENGSGKTTVLNTLYSLLSADLSRLKKIPFKSLELYLNDGRRFRIEKDSLYSAPKQEEASRYYDHLERIFGSSSARSLVETFLKTPPTHFYKSAFFASAAKKMGISSAMLYEFLASLTSERNEGLPGRTAHSTIKEVQEALDFKILYLPTYRRVEQDFRNLRTSELEDDPRRTKSINFGMSDVTDKIKEVTQEIVTSSIEWFAKVNGEMLSQLVEGIHIDSALKESVRNTGAVEIVLNRIGANINEEQKSKIIKLVESGEIENGHDPLIYFISNLLKVYEQQRENDRSIQLFTEVCNRYLADKKLEYDEGSVSVKIVRRKSREEVDIETLSSGEKQIISLFCNLYLSKGGDFAIFFDEPELSLSIEWQKTLLPDVVRSGKCSFLFATTHSPFIFANELASKTVDIGTYTKEL